MTSLRERRDAADHLIRERTKRGDTKRLRATVSIRIDGRMSLGRAFPTECRITVDLLHGSASEADLLRKIRDAIESTYYADFHIAQRAAVEGRLAARSHAAAAEHQAWLEAQALVGKARRGRKR